MDNYICTLCGVQFAATPSPPELCPICADERQSTIGRGQPWTTLQALGGDHNLVLQEAEPGLLGIGTKPRFAIGQRALLVQSASGNVLWDCISLVDEATVDAAAARGGVAAIAISHPHFYGAMVEWSHAFGGVPIYLHGADREWVMRPDPAIIFWEGDRYELSPGLQLVHCGGHFPGATILHWAAGAGGRGALLTGDVIHVVPDQRAVSFMYSYPNLLPLAAPAVQRIAKTLETIDYERLYGGWFHRVIQTDAKAVVAQSATRYTELLAEPSGVS